MKQLDEFPQHQNTKQDWPRLLDGKIYELVANEDFTCQPQSLRSLALGQARKRGGKVRTSISKDQTTLTLQFVKDEPTVLEDELAPDYTFPESTEV